MPKKKKLAKDAFLLTGQPVSLSLAEGDKNQGVMSRIACGFVRLYLDSVGYERKVQMNIAYAIALVK